MNEETIAHPYRSHSCGALRKSDVGRNVRLSGWVHRVRDHGHLLFIDLRDHYGITQIVVDASSPAFQLAERLKAESVIRVDGTVVARSSETVNPDLATGEIEVQAREITVLSAAEELPLPVFGEPEYPEEIRLKYRYLDLRRESMHRRILLRSAVVASIRRRMQEQGFVEFQTPILTASSPEGARDFLVPSRLHPGKFYALPQAPQIFKQLVMVSGFDRYFQIAPCFRDEDARADRSPGEFYQLDVEMAFATQDDVFAAIEPVMHGVFAEFSDRPVTEPPFPRIPYAEAMVKYGTDKPDLRNPIAIADVSDIFAGGGFGLFARIVADGGVVRAIPAPGASTRGRSFFDRINNWAREELKAAGLGYIFYKDGEPSGPIAKNLEAERLRRLVDRLGLTPADGVFFAAGPVSVAAELAGAARTRLGEELGLIDRERYAFCWIVDFPMYEWDEEEKRWDFSHNPFSMPQGGLEALETKDPGEILAWQYDIVCNGVELSSGAIRNHDPAIMRKAFAIAGYDEDVLKDKFRALWNAFHYGAPPHGGIAPGLDRIVMLLADVPNIREVTLFPMNQKAEDLMMGAPAPVSETQLKELHIRVVPPPKIHKTEEKG